MRRLTVGVLACALTIALSACAKQTTQPDETRPPARRAIPNDSPLAKVKEGMGMKEVADLIGQPTDTNAHITGKAFIPFYFGSGSTEVQAFYKGMGRVIYSGGGVGGGPRVISVEYDPSESGYSR